jgi:catechol 2,3-dioxygenase-like lactoylglutathione lyase family enzyme
VSPVLAALDVAGDADSWRTAGFHVDDDGAIRTGHIVLHSATGERGIKEWHLADGPHTKPAAHPNTTIALDHLVVFTDDPDRTTRRYEGLGLPLKREREVGNGTAQRFFRAGEAIIELVGPIPDVVGESFWGLAFTVADLDACARLLGDAIGTVKDAVQPGRRIATLRHKHCGLSVPIAFMSQ